MSLHSRALGWDHRKKDMCLIKLQVGLSSKRIAQELMLTEVATACVTVGARDWARLQLCSLYEVIHSFYWYSLTVQREKIPRAMDSVIIDTLHLLTKLSPRHHFWAAIILDERDFLFSNYYKCSYTVCLSRKKGKCSTQFIRDGSCVLSYYWFWTSVTE